ncbi:hypothetical protein HUT19_01075 [Streptomyces sp. NA02950]|uniref:hypothetical protein n=1 Tax=Streptomyces sp. NA02950 TaxID=2742137 RepID=UPI00158FED9B|nr:hypothetical protein [Streptomyces sp. NA02950]QKV90540.1 hypothetical protein HUT19_01075 [Streptomyces sp. NA02950]
MTHPTTIDEHAPVIAEHAIRIAAPLERIWQPHTTIGSWPGRQSAAGLGRVPAGTQGVLYRFQGCRGGEKRRRGPGVGVGRGRLVGRCPAHLLGSSPSRRH